MSFIIKFVALGFVAATSVLALGPAAIPLGTGGNYVIVGETGVSTVPPSAITGDVALSPSAGSFFTGFSLTLAPSGTFSTSLQVVGKLYAASYGSPTPSQLTTLIGDVVAAYNYGAGLTGPNFTNLASGALAGLTLAPGLYKWTSAVVASAGFTISGSATDVWIFQVAGTLKISANQKVTLANGALVKNIFWVVAGATDIGAGAIFQGNILDKTSVTVETGATVHGRILAQTGVALQKATIIAT